MLTTGGFFSVNASEPVPLAGSQIQARPAFSLPMVSVGAGSFCGLTSIRSKENSRTLPVGSSAMWAAKSGDWKYSRNRPNSAASKDALAFSWEAVSALSRSVRVVCGYSPMPAMAVRVRACASACSLPSVAASSGSTVTGALAAREAGPYGTASPSSP